jgi:hypothetical protein
MGPGIWTLERREKLLAMLGVENVAPGYRIVLKFGVKFYLPFILEPKIVF